MQQGNCESLLHYFAAIAACIGSQCDENSDVRDSLTLRTTLRQRGHLTLSFQNNVFPSFSHLLQPVAALVHASLLLPIPTPGVDPLAHKVPLTLFSLVVHYVL